MGPIMNKHKIEKKSKQEKERKRGIGVTKLEKILELED